MRETKAQGFLTQYLRDQRKKKFYCWCELKVARGSTFAFSKIEKGQHEGLPALANEGLVWKFSDEDSRQKPCDCASLPPLPSYLVILFNETFVFIDYQKIVEMRESGKKSITHTEALMLSTRIVHMGH